MLAWSFVDPLAVLAQLIVGCGCDRRYDNGECSWCVIAWKWTHPDRKGNSLVIFLSLGSLAHSLDHGCSCLYRGWGWGGGGVGVGVGGLLVRMFTAVCFCVFVRAHPHCKDEFDSGYEYSVRICSCHTRNQPMSDLNNKRYPITSQTRVTGPQSPSSISSSFILFSILLPFFLKTKNIENEPAQ